MLDYWFFPLKNFFFKPENFKKLFVTLFYLSEVNLIAILDWFLRKYFSDLKQNYRRRKSNITKLCGVAKEIKLQKDVLLDKTSFMCG